MAAPEVFWQPPCLLANILFLLKTNKSRCTLSERATKRGHAMEHSETDLMLKGYGLTTAEFFYRMPDYTHVLNTFVWQEYDLAPDHPRLFRFIEFWQDSIEGKLHSVRFSHRRPLASGDWRQVVGEFRYH
jgi:uncharacterized protein Usg